MCAYTVRREKVHRVLLWLKHYNRAYADIDISDDLLAMLPVNGAPNQVVRSAAPSPDDNIDFKEYGPDAARTDLPTPDESGGPPLEVPFAAAVIDNEGAEITAAEEWQHALGARARPPQRNNRLDPVALWNMATNAAEQAARLLSDNICETTTSHTK